MISIATISSVLGWLVDATVKGSVVILLIAAIQSLVGRRLDARWRHALWLIVLLRLALPIAPSSSWSIFNLLPETAAVPLQIHEAHLPVPAIEAPLLEMPAGPLALRTPRWAGVWMWIAALWLAGVVALAARALVATLRIHLAVNAALRRSVARPDLQEVVDVARRQLLISQPVRIIECDVVKTPALHGLWRPTLLFPISLADTFRRDELRHVVLHELWHLRRFDVALNWILSAVQTLHWFNPFVWFAISRIQEERELACDELALSCLEEDERLGYGTTILKLLERFRTAAPVPALVGIVNHKQKMKRRLMMIATFRNRTRFSMLFLLVVAAIGAVGLTDARGGQRRVMKDLNPAALATLDRLDQRISFEVTNASFGELLNAVANKTGVAVTQSPEVAGSSVQQARFTIKADNVPAHAVLMEALMPFQVSARPDANGVTIEKGMVCIIPGEEDVEVSSDGGLFEKKIERRVIVRKKEGDGLRERADEHPAHDGDDRVVIRRMAPAECRLSADGKLHRELTLKTDVNGVKSEGKLSIDIQAPPPAK